MNVLLTGASGFIGSHILQALLQEGHRVTACVRTPEKLQQRYPSVTAIKCDFARDVNPQDWTPRLGNIDTVINAVGIISEHGDNRFVDLHTRAPIALFTAAVQNGVRKVIQVSALGADESAKSAYHLSKRTADEHLANSQLDWTILRPSIVHGTGGQSTAFFRAMASLPFIPLIAGGKQEIQPIDIDDLTRIVVMALSEKRLSKTVLNVVGPEPMSFRDFLVAQRSWLGLSKGWFVFIPYYLALVTGTVAGWFGSVVINRETVRMLQRGNIADVAPQINATGFKPVSVKATLAAAPATTADAWYAQLVLLAPVLRYSIAFVWLFTGLVSIWGYPIESSYALLQKVGVPDALKPITLYGAASLDILLGIATLAMRRLRSIAALQILIIISYTTIISFALPEYWLHPFGPISKNLPLIVAISMMAALSEKR